MKKILYILIFAIIAAGLSAQAPQSFKYQTVVRETDGSIIADQDVSFQISILQYADDGDAIYVETFGCHTNDYGLATFNIGEGTTTDDFTDIDWNDGPYFVLVEIDPDGGAAYEEVGTSQLLSVPYALHAKTSEDAFSGDYNELINVPTVAQTDTTYIVELTSTDEDYIDFGTFEAFTNSSDWSIIEQVMMPAGTGAAGGWHFFRGKGWEDKEGDIAIQMTTSNVYAWCQKGGWKSVSYNTVLEEKKWYTICLQYDAAANTLNLYLDGTMVQQTPGVLPQNDSGNSNKLFWGGQDVAPGHLEGDLYSEESIIISSQHWLQRKLTGAEISEYNGKIEPEAALFFSAKINPGSVTDNSGNGHDGTIGNTPDFSAEVLYLGSEANEPVNISGISSYGMIEANTTGIGAALFMNSDGNYEEADADDIATMPCVALALETGTGNKKILLQGYICNDSWTWTPGGLVYVSPTTGVLTQTIPSTTGQQVQIAGYASKTTTVYFNPNLLLIEIK